MVRECQISSGISFSYKRELIVLYKYKIIFKKFKKELNFSMNQIGKNLEKKRCLKQTYYQNYFIKRRRNHFEAASMQKTSKIRLVS